MAAHGSDQGCGGETESTRRPSADHSRHLLLKKKAFQVYREGQGEICNWELNPHSDNLQGVRPILWGPSPACSLPNGNASCLTHARKSHTPPP